MAERAAVEPGAQTLKGLRVLVADDDEVNVMIFSALLEMWGAELDVAVNGHQAVESVRTGSYDLVLMDLKMPGLDGYAADRMDPRELDAAGFTEFVGKPIDPDLLFQTLARYAGAE